MRYINFDNVKVGDVVYLDSYKEVLEQNDKAEVVSVTAQRFRTKQSTHRGDQIIEHNKDNGSRRGYCGRRALCFASPEGVQQYRQMLVEINEASIELDRKIKVAKNVQEWLRHAGINAIVDGYGSFTVKFHCNEEELKKLADVLIESGVKL
jgi:hypothetical protein